MKEKIYSFNTEMDPLLEEVGGKAKSLICTTRAGLPVPGGFALSVAFFKSWTEKIKESPEWESLLNNPVKENCDRIKAIAERLTFTDEQQFLFDEAMVGLSGGKVFAVRSSSPEEDLEGSSFAGMYETFLGTPRKLLEGTIARAYSSMLDFRVMEYKAQNSIKIDNACISIIVQKQIDSDVSGVGFSLNPMNNCYDEVVINASYGLGEAIVSGIVTPDNYVVEKVCMEIISKTINEKKIALHLSGDGGITEKENKKPDEQALSDNQILELTGLISKCEEYYSLPIDTEWAYEKGQLYLLQARPVTTYIPLYPELLTKPGEPKKLYVDMIGALQGFREPISVLGLDIWTAIMDSVGAQGMMPEGKDGIIRHIHGREFMLASNTMKAFGRMISMKMLTTEDYAFNGREKELFREYKSKEMTPLMMSAKKGLSSVTIKSIPILLRTFTNKKKAKEDGISARDKAIRDLKDFRNNKPFDILIKEGIDILKLLLPHVYGYILGSLAIGKIRKMFKGKKLEADIAALGMDLASNPTSVMAKRQFDLASSADFKEVKGVEDFKEKVSRRLFSDKFMEMFDEYMYWYGDRGFKEIDIATVRTRDDLDGFYTQLININIEDSQILKVKEKKGKAYDLLCTEADKIGKLKRFQIFADTHNSLFGAREMPKYVVTIYLGVLRDIAVEIGGTFVKEGRLNKPDDIFDLHLNEVTAAQEDAKMDLLSLMENNTAGYKEYAHITNWPVTIDSRGKILYPVKKGEEGDFVGEAISAGIIKGYAKVLKTPYEKPVLQGEILVTHATEPSWTPVFNNASGVVLEVGGMLQHGAIIAREYGLPCVSGIRTAMEKIKDGDLLEVDGTNGIVRIIVEE